MSNQLFILYALAGGLFLLAFAFAILSVKSAKINSLVVNFLLAIGAFRDHRQYLAAFKRYC